MVQHIEKNKTQYEKTSLAIWELAELGFQEDKSTLLLQNLLKENGFNVVSGQEGMSTAFIAEFGEENLSLAFLQNMTHYLDCLKKYLQI